MRLGKLHSAKAPLTTKIWLSLSLSLRRLLPRARCFWIHRIPSTAITKASTTAITSAYRHLLCACSLHLRVHFFPFPLSLSLVDSTNFHFKICVAHKGTVHCTPCCTHYAIHYVEHIWHTVHSTRMSVCARVHLYNAQWQHDKWIRNLIFLHAVYYHQSFHFQFVLFVWTRNFCELCRIYFTKVSMCVCRSHSKGRVWQTGSCSDFWTLLRRLTK